MPTEVPIRVRGRSSGADRSHGANVLGKVRFWPTAELHSRALCCPIHNSTNPRTHGRMLVT